MGNPMLLETLRELERVERVERVEALKGLERPRGIPVTYILKLRSDLYYTGCSTDFPVRLSEHANGTACRTTHLDPPVALVWTEIQTDLPAARKREAQIKKWSREKKEALIAGDRLRLRNLSKSRD